jgi:hypothetical protein
VYKKLVSTPGLRATVVVDRGSSQLLGVRFHGYNEDTHRTNRFSWAYCHMTVWARGLPFWTTAARSVGSDVVNLRPRNATHEKGVLDKLCACSWRSRSVQGADGGAALTTGEAHPGRGAPAAQASRSWAPGVGVLSV